MAIRLCQACLHEIKEGDKLCNNCNVSVNRHATVIEVMSEYEGYSYVSNRYAYHDENLNNYKHEPLKDTRNSRLYPDNIPIEKKKYDVGEVALIEENADFVGNFMKMIKNPSYYFDVLMGLLGSILLIVGDLSAMYNNFYSGRQYKTEYFNYMSSFIVAIALCAMLLVLKHKKKYVLIPVLTASTLLIFGLTNVNSAKSLGVGYYVMWLAIVMLIISAVVSNKSIIKKYFLGKADLIWILLTFFISLSLANTLNYYYGNGKTKAASPGTGTIDTDTINIPKEEIKTVDIENEKFNLQVSLLDSYLVSFNNKDMIVVELSVYNKGDKSVKLEEALKINAKQNGKSINYEQKIDDVTYFDMNAKNEKIKKNSCKTMFYGFFIQPEGDISLVAEDKESNNEIINQVLTVNSKFYVSTNVSSIPDGATEIMQEAEKNKNKKWNIYFVKPSSWSDDICAYIYYLDKKNKIKELEKWPGKSMEYDNGFYTFTYDKNWFGKARVIIVDKNNTSNRFPGEDSVGLLIEGNINITPNK